jgi:hypothetical protein
MKTIEELTDEMVAAVRVNKRARELEMIDMVLKAKPSNISKRSALGLDRQKKASAHCPECARLFDTQKSLF